MSVDLTPRPEAQSDGGGDGPPPSEQHEDSAFRAWLGKAWPHLRWVVAFVVAVVAVVVVVGVYRLNTFIAAATLISVNVVLLAAAVFGRLSLAPSSPLYWSPWVSRVCYPVGLAVGLGVAISSSNIGAQLAALVVLAGLHAVAGAALLTWITRPLSSCRRVSGLQLAVSTAIGLVALVLAVIVDIRGVHRTVGIDSRIYVAAVALAVVVTGWATVEYVRIRSRNRLPSLSIVAGFVCLVGGAAVVVTNLVLLAYWRNNDPVAGPPIHELPAIPAFEGDFVALGDSYSAGEGLRPFEAFTESDLEKLGDGCHRSQLAYSQLLRFEPPEPAQRFVACSGAVTADIFTGYTIVSADGGRLHVPPQVPGDADEDVGLVTITIGGNDAVFSRVVTHCFLRSDCLDADFKPPPDQPERNVILPTQQPLREWAEEVLTGPSQQSVESKVRVVYEALEEAYPNARIIAIGYPYLFPERRPPTLNLTDCQTILRRFSHSERQQVRELQDDLNQVLHDAAVEAGVEFISPTAGWDTHEPCGSSGEQYTNSIKPFLVTPLTGFELGDGGTFHPNEAGQRELARLITCYLVANPEPPDRAVGDAAIGSVENPVPDCRRDGT